MFTRKLSFRAFLARTVSVAALTCMAPALVHAQNLSINIENQSLAGAVTELSRKANVVIVAPAELLAGRSVRSLQGSMTVEDALDQLLLGTNLKFMRNSEDTYVVIQKSLFQKISYTTDADYIENFAAYEEDEQRDNIDNFVLDEITVTARKREESLQEVPDSVTVFGATTIEKAGIETIDDIFDMTPNLTFRGSAFRKGDFRLSLRGIGNGQQGWAATSFLIDGVPSLSLDSINSGLLTDIERIEILRGPQSALYGANAIAGAVNVITKEPANEFEGRIKLGYGSGNDRKIQGRVSGALIEDKLLYRVNVGWRDFDGVFKSASNGEDLDFEESLNIKGRLIWHATENLTLDMRAEYLDEDTGSTYQEKISGFDLIETFTEQTRARRDLIGKENRDIQRYAVKIDWDLGGLTLTSTSAFSDIEQNALAGACWDDPNDPAVDTDPLTPGGQVGCVFGAAVGSDGASPGDVIDNFFVAIDNFEAFTQDIRLSSSDDGRARWLIGVSYTDRKAKNGFNLGELLSPGTFGFTFPVGWHVREDTWWGGYGQVSVDLTDALEFTVAVRYDDMKAKNTRYVGETFSVIQQVADDDGNLVNTLVEEDSSFQPKVQLSYQWTDDFMTYATLSRGYRAGFFNTGNYTLPESTDNYEVGFKSTLAEGHLLFNGAIFHIDYSNQQSSTTIAEPPFRVAVTIPDTNIDGLEFETIWVATEKLRFGASIGYLKAKVADGTTSPFTSDWTGNFNATFEQPLTGDLDLVLRGDYRYQGNTYVPQSGAPTPGFFVSPQHLLNLRAGVEGEVWRLTAYVNNAFNERYPLDGGALVAGGVVRSQNVPRTYGAELIFNF